MRVISGHQPVYLPWLGLLHKLELADVFVVMDDVQYLRQDWNNRNYIKGPKEKVRLTAPVDLKRSASMLLKDIRLVDEGGLGDRGHWQNKHFQAIRAAYAKAPHYREHAPFLESLYLEREWRSLSALNLFILRYFLKEFGIETELATASECAFEGAKSNLVLDHCVKLKADICVVGMHGRDYIDVAAFQQKGMHLHFQHYAHPVYPQRFPGFVSHLSALDLLLNAGPSSREIFLSDNVSKRDLLRAARAAHGPGILEQRDVKNA